MIIIPLVLVAACWTAALVPSPQQKKKAYLVSNAAYTPVSTTRERAKASLMSGSLVDMAKDIKDVLGLHSTIVSVPDICTAAHSELGLAMVEISALPLRRQIERCHNALFLRESGAAVGVGDNSDADNGDGYVHVGAVAARQEHDEIKMYDAAAGSNIPLDPRPVYDSTVTYIGTPAGLAAASEGPYTPPVPGQRGGYRLKYTAPGEYEQVEPASAPALPVPPLAAGAIGGTSMVVATPAADDVTTSPGNCTGREHAHPAPVFIIGNDYRNPVALLAEQGTGGLASQHAASRLDNKLIMANPGYAAVTPPSAARPYINIESDPGGDSTVMKSAQNGRHAARQPQRIVQRSPGKSASMYATRSDDADERA